MAKALFHKMQRVYVKPVGTWAHVEQVIPHWVKDVDEPLRITYECGLGRQFLGHELVSEQVMYQGTTDRNADDDPAMECWTIARRVARWHQEFSPQSPTHPGTYPAVVTEEDGTGGWRVSKAEFDRDPERIEYQARMIVRTPELLRIVRRIAEFAAEHPGDVPEDLKQVITSCSAILRFIYQLTDTPEAVAAE
jgi:hypothetical protein